MPPTRPRLTVGLLAAAVLWAASPAPAAKPAPAETLPKGALRRLGSLRLRYGSVGGLDYLPDGRALVASGRDLDIWDMARAEKLETLRIANSGVACMRLNRAGTRVLFKDGGDVVEYSLAENRPVHRFPTRHAGFNALVYSPDETRVLTTGGDPPILKEFVLVTAEETASIRGDLAVFTGAVYGPGARTALVGGGYNTSLAHYDLQTGQKLFETRLGYSIYEMVLSPDGERLLMGCRHDAIEFKLDGSKKLNQFRGHHGHAVTAVAYGKAPDEILTGSRDGSIRRWNRVTAEVLLRWVPHSSYCTRLQVSPDGRRVLSFGAGRVVESDLRTGQPTSRCEGHSQAVEAVVLMPGGRRVASASADASLRLWDVDSGAALTVIPGAALGAYALAVAPDGRKLAAGCKDGVLREFSAADGTLLRALKGHLGYVRSAAYTPDGRRLISSADDGSIRVWSTRGDAPAEIMTGHRGGVLAAAVSADGRLLLSGGRDGTVRLWDLQSARLLRTLEGHRGWVQAVGFAPGGGQAYSSGRDGRIVKWNVLDGRVESEMVHGGWVRAIACSPDGKTLCAGGEDNRITCWDLDSGAQTGVLGGHRSPVLGLAIAPDGRRVVSANADASLLVWEIPLSKPRERKK